MAFEGEKDTDSPAADNAPAAALTGHQLERQLPPPWATPLSTRARRRRGPLFRARRAAPTSSLFFAGASPLMRCVDDSRSLPRCLDTTPTRGHPPPPADDSAAGRPAAGLFTLRSGRHARNARRQAAPGAPRVLPRGTGRLTQYCSVQYTIHIVRPPRAYATAPGDPQRHISAALHRERPAGALLEGHGRRRRGAVGGRKRKISCAHAPDVQSSRAVGAFR
jgi:hypothetical protein